MLVSRHPDFPFIFIHVWKTGGTSVSRALTRALRARIGRLSYWRMVDENVIAGEPAGHLPARDVLPWLESRGVRGLHSFGLVRCPWSRLVSMFEFTTKGREAFEKRFGARGVGRSLLAHERRGLDAAYRYFTEDRYVGFRRWLQQSQRMAHGSAVTWPVATVPQLYSYTDGHGDLLVDRVYRLDDLETLQKDVRERFGLDLEMRPENVGSYKRSLAEYFDDEALAFVEKHHHADIQTFGFVRPF